MESIRFRRARREDVATIVAMLADDELGAARERPGPPPDPGYYAAFDAVEADPNQFLMVAESGGAVIGCLQISFIPGLSRIGMLRGQIESVRVAGGWRGKGVGRRMIEAAVEECQRRGCGSVQLTSDKRRHDAHRFYAGLGFVASHEGMKRTL